MTTLGGSEGDHSDCTGIEPSASEGPIVLEETRPSLYVMGSGTPTSIVIVLTTKQVAAVSYEGYGRIPTHASALLPDHMRGAILELRGRVGERRIQFPNVKLLAWSKNGKPIARAFGKAPPLAFSVPSRSWSPGMPEPSGVCSINVSGLDQASFQEGTVMSTVRPRGNVRSGEFVNCADANYRLAQKEALRANVLLDATHPGATPARLPGIRPLPGHPGIFTGPGGEELARRIPSAWLLVTKGEDLAQRITLLEHLNAKVNLSVH